MNILSTTNFVQNQNQKRNLNFDLSKTDALNVFEDLKFSFIRITLIRIYRLRFADLF